MAMIAQPLVALAILWFAGLGAAAILGKRLPHDAQVALAAPLAAALLSCASALVYFERIPIQLVAGAVLVS